MTARKMAVLLLAHGSPETPADVPEFLRLITGGKPVPDSVIQEVTHRYEQIGHSPLLETTRQQAELLREKIGMPVYVGMRNWRPFVADVVRDMATNGIARAVVVCLAPQNSQTSVGLYRSALFSAAAGTNIEIEFVESWHDHPELIAAFAERLRARWKQACSEAGTEIPVIFTAHSVPMRTIADGDAYALQARETAKLVSRRVTELAETEVRFAFQSQGMSREPWIGPTVEETILKLKRSGYAGVLIQPIGFLCDHVEVLYDIDIGFKKFAEQQGMRLWRTESLNESAKLTAALADVVCTAARGARLQASAEHGDG
jgi:ferrochelatase